MSLPNADEKTRNAIYNLIIWRRNAPKQEYELGDGIELIELPPINNQKFFATLKRAPNPLPGNPVLILAHGNGETQDIYIRDQESPFSPTESFVNKGISVCSFDYRGYGSSEGEYGASSLTEKEDTIALIRYLKSQGFEKISYFGRSLGATCGIFAAAEFPDLVCVALDSPWISTRGWTEHKAKAFSKIEKEKFDELLPSVYETIKNETGLDFNASPEPEDVANQITVPIYVIHGSKDRLVPITNSERLMEIVNSAEKTFLPFKGDHNSFNRYLHPYQYLINFILQHNGLDPIE